MTTKAKKDYSKGKVYKIEPICDHDEGDIYIGSTTKQYLSQRMVKHRDNFKQWKKGKRDLTTSFNLFDKYGIQNLQIVLLESVNAKNCNELEAREAHYIQSLKCVNKNIPNGIARINYTCQCGSQCIVKHKQRHFKTEKHKHFLLQLDEPARGGF